MSKKTLTEEKSQRAQTSEQSKGCAIRYTAFFLFTMILLFPLVFAGQAIRKGQVIKQFFAYSITESLAHHPFAILTTRLPCNPPRIWVEEPPLFHSLAAAVLRIFPGETTPIPFLSFLLVSLGIFLIQGNLNPSQRKPAWQHLIPATLLAVYCPIFLRYSVQHLPDLLATAFLTLGAAALLKDHRFFAGGSFLLAITTKALTGFAVAPLLFWYFFLKRKDTRAFLKWALWLFVLGVPFLLWLSILYQQGVPNPFFIEKAQKWVENRHSGSLGLLLTFRYYLRAFTWVAIKGVGLVLLWPAIYSLVKIYRSDKFTGPEGMLFCWAVGILPYWLIIRQANMIHDYYTLPFAVPLAILGVHQLLRLRPAWLLSGAAAIHLTIGLSSLARMREVAIGKDQIRPLHCEMENWNHGAERSVSAMRPMNEPKLFQNLAQKGTLF